MSYTYTPLYYGAHTPVRFFESESQTFIKGIAYHDNITVIDKNNQNKKFDIQKIIDDAERANIFFDDAIVELDRENLF